MCFHPLGRKGLDTRLRGYDGFGQTDWAMIQQVEGMAKAKTLNPQDLWISCV